jgi:hypothetical protein
MLARLKALLRGTRAEGYDEKVDRIRGMIGDVVPALGKIMEHSPLVIFPVSELPLPKDEMKIALQLAWGMTTDEQLKCFVAVAYLQLAHFRDDITRPIDPTLAMGLTPTETIELLAPYLAISDAIVAESNELLREFGEFERLSLAMYKN